MTALVKSLSRVTTAVTSRMTYRVTTQARTGQDRRNPSHDEKKERAREDSESDEFGCDHCGAVPSRVDTFGARHCRSCAPRLWGEQSGGFTRDEQTNTDHPKEGSNYAQSV